MKTKHEESSFSLADSPDYPVLRSMAISAGDMSRAVRREVETIMTVNKNHIGKAFASILGTLADKKLIAADEKEPLQEVFDILLNAIRKKEDAGKAYATISTIYNDMVISSNASPAALSIASVANAAFLFDKSVSVAHDVAAEAATALAKVTITPMTTGAGAVIGAGIGAAIGSAFGGFGAGIGAAVGAAAGAAIGFCNEHGI